MNKDLIERLQRIPADLEYDADDGPHERLKIGEMARETIAALRASVPADVEKCRDPDCSCWFLNERCSAQADAGMGENDQHYFSTIRKRLEQLYDASAHNPRLREQLSDEVDWVDTMLTRPLPPSNAVREALKKLVAKLEFCHADDSYQRVWTSAHLRFGPYSGPQYANELKEAKAALAALPPAQETKS
jgi:hypothetical protein